MEIGDKAGVLGAAVELFGGNCRKKQCFCLTDEDF